MNNKTNIKNDIYFLFNMLKREEELKYLDFIRDVTNDVLERGIFSNRLGFQTFIAMIIKSRKYLDSCTSSSFLAVYLFHKCYLMLLKLFDVVEIV